VGLGQLESWRVISSFPRMPGQGPRSLSRRVETDAGAVPVSTPSEVGPGGMGDSALALACPPSLMSPAFGPCLPAVKA
jgi:hypothetical protein